MWKQLIVSALVISGVTGCSILGPNANVPKAPTDIGDVLPKTLAGPPETLNMQRRIPDMGTMRAANLYGIVHIYSGGAWRGRKVTLYYVPAQDVIVDRGHFDLRSAKDVQKIGEAAINSGGSFSSHWNIKHERLAHWRMFVMARTDEGQIGLAQVNHLQKW